MLAYLKGPKAGAAPAASENNDSDYQGRGGRGGAAGGRGGARTKYGSDMVVMDLRVKKERTFEDVSDYSMAKDGKTLAYTVASKKEESNGAYAVVPGTDSMPVALLSGKGRYSIFDFVHEDKLAPQDLAKYSALLLPNTALLSDEQCRQLRAYADSGGSLLATFESSMYTERNENRSDFGLPARWFPRLGRRKSLARRYEKPALRPTSDPAAYRWLATDTSAHRYDG